MICILNHIVNICYIEHIGAILNEVDDVHRELDMACLSRWYRNFRMLEVMWNRGMARAVK